MAYKNPEFNLEYQFGLYLERSGVKPEHLHPVQLSETKKAFFGGCGQMLFMLRDDMPDKEQEAIEVFKSLEEQVLEFFKKETEGELL